MVTKHRADLPVWCSCFPLAMYFTFGKKKRNWVICSEVDGPRVCHTEWSKSEREKQIPYANAYIWNLEKTPLSTPSSLGLCSRLIDDLLTPIGSHHPWLCWGSPAAGTAGLHSRAISHPWVCGQAGNTGELMPLQAGLADGSWRVTAQLPFPMGGSVQKWVYTVSQSPQQDRALVAHSANWTNNMLLIGFHLFSVFPTPSPAGASWGHLPNKLRVLEPLSQDLLWGEPDSKKALYSKHWF